MLLPHGRVAHPWKRKYNKNMRNIIIIIIIIIIGGGGGGGGL
jgi:hypothetical protein